MIEQTPDTIALGNAWFRLELGQGPGMHQAVRGFTVSPQGSAGPTFPVRLNPWTGFAGVTSHTREFFVTTEGPQSPHVEILDDTPTVSRVRYGPLWAASWEVYWTINLAGDALAWEVSVHVHRNTRPDAEVNLLAFDVPEGEEIVAARFDSGYLLPPKHWFAINKPIVTYSGNDSNGNILDRRVRLRFAGDGHDTLQLKFAGGYGLAITSPGDNDFRIVPKVVYKPAAPRDPKRLPLAEFAFKASERVAIGTNRRKEDEPLPANTRLHAQIVITPDNGEWPETMCLETPGEPSIGGQTVALHRTHAMGSIAHRHGFAGGWHNTGMRNGHSVSFEYYMHGRAHWYGLDPVIDQVMANALDSVFQRETYPDGLIWQHGFGGRGAFYENNASMLIFLADYARRTGDLSRLHYGRKWADYILSCCTEAPFLYYEKTSTGRAGFQKGAYVCNWWDVVGAGGYDAFINVLTYPGLRDLAMLHEAAGETDHAQRYRDASERFRQSFNDLFWGDTSGRYISWVDSEGERYDYFFTATNLIAAYEGLADKSRRKRILDSIRAKLDELGYPGFSLPCNLISIPPEHYNAGDWWLDQYGYPHFHDNFGTYENGGIFPWLSSYYTAALAEFDPDAALDHYLGILNQYERDELQGAGNGYFWDIANRSITEGSTQEPYLANVAMNVWSLFTLFGVEAHPTRGLRIRPRLPRRLSNSTWSMRYQGRRITFTFQGHGTKVQKLTVNQKEIPNPADSLWIPPELLSEGTTLDVSVAP